MIESVVTTDVMIHEEARRRSERAPFMQPNDFRVIVELLPVALCVHRAGRVLFANRAFTEALGSLEGLEPTFGAQVEEIDRALESAAEVSRHLSPRSPDARTFSVHATRTTFDDAPATVWAMRDVSEQVALRSELARSEARHRAALGAMNEGVVVRDANGALLAHNAAAERILGLTADQLAGREPPPPGFASFDESGQRTSLRLGERLLRGEPVKRGHLLRLEGPRSGRWLSLNVEPLREGDAIVGLVYTMNDVTEQRVERERELDLARLRGLSNRINEIEIVVRSDGALLEVNDRACEAYGYARDELLAMNIRDLRAEETRAAVGSQMAEAASVGIRFRTNHRRRDGSTFPVEVSSRRVEVGGESYLHSLVRDLTDELRREEEHRLLSGLVLSMEDAVLVTDAELRIVEYSGRAREIYGWEREEALGRRLDRDFVGEFVDGDGDDVAQKSRRGEGSRARIRCLCKDGSWTVVDTITTPLRDEDGGLRGLLLVSRDITRQLALESELRERDERLRSILAAMVEGVVMHDAAGRLVTANAAAEDLLGISRASGIDGAWLDPHCQAVREDGSALAPNEHPTVRALKTGQAFARELVGVRRPNGEQRWLSVSARPLRRAPQGAPSAVVTTFTDVTSLLEAQHEIKTLSGLLPVCMWCKKIRDDTGYWERIEAYLGKHTGAQFSHGLCPDCLREHYPDHAEDILKG